MGCKDAGGYPGTAVAGARGEVAGSIQYTTTMNKTTEQLNADTLFAFQMALNGHKQFEFLRSGIWTKCDAVSSIAPHRISHDIPECWTRHNGEDWKGDKDAVIEEVMFYSGRILKEERTAEYWGCKYGINNFTKAESQENRIYAYKLAAKSPAIPVIEKKVIPWTFADAPLNAKVKRKSDGKIFRMSAHPDEAGLYPTSYGSEGERVAYEILAADYLQLDGSVCGTEVEQ